MRGSGHIQVVRAGFVVALVALACVMSLALAGPAQARVVVKERESGAAGEQRILDYWTDERLEAARPLEAIRDENGDPVIRRGDREAFNHPAPFESGPVANPSAPPNTINGKVFGRIRGIGQYECSATSLDALNRNLIMTAGHCVAEPGLDLANRIVFIPSYEDGVRPYGTWVFDKIFVLKSWRKRQNFNFDFSAVRMSPQAGTGSNLQDVVGGVPISTNYPVEQTYTSVGYPANIDDGQIMRYCTGPFAGRDPQPLPNGPLPIAMGCDMLQGASGGGWFANGSLVSVTSFGYQNHKDIGYGPYLGSKAQSLYNSAAG